MRPHRLRVQAFGAFAAAEQIVFDDLEGLFLLHGETGAGKTTLLDAIAFALYGRVPGERGVAKRLRSDHANPDLPTEVELEATLGGHRLRITRKPEQERQRKRGSGTTTEPASVRLDERTASGTWENKSVRIAEADKEIADLMGMSAEQFFQVVLLPQGQFARFLHADVKDKEALLQKLFGTDRFRRVEDWLADRRRATEKDVAAAQDTVNTLVAQLAQAASVTIPDQAPDPSAWAADLAATAAADQGTAAELVAACKSELDTALAAKSEAEHLAGRQRRRREALTRQAALEAAAPGVRLLRAEADAAGRAAEVAAVLDAADRAVAGAESAHRGEARARAALPDTPSGLRAAGPEALRAAGQEQQAQVGRLEALRAVERQVAAEEKAAADARSKAGRIAGDLLGTQSAADARHESRLPAQEARDAASQAAAALPAIQSQAKNAQVLAADVAALLKEHKKRSRLHEAHQSAREQANNAHEAELRVREARINGMRAELAAAMTDGTPCPVCGSLDHPDPVDSTSFPPVSRDEEDAATRTYTAAARAADEAGRQVAAADAVIGDLKQRVVSAGLDLPEIVDPQALAIAAREADAGAKRLAGEAAGISAQATALDALQRTLDALDTAIAADQTRLVELTEQRSAALAEAEAAERRAADRSAELRTQLGGASDLGTALTQSKKLVTALVTAANAAEETARADAEVAAETARAAGAATDAGFPDVAAAKEARRDDRWRKDAAERISRHEAETEAVASLLADPDLADVPLDPPAPVTEKTAAADCAQQAYDAANQVHATARHRTDQLARLMPRLNDALADLAPLRKRADQAKHLADLAAGLGTANQYRMTLSSFVLAARLEEVAAAASERLLTMTAGRYSLVHSDAKRGGGKAGLSLLACDSWTGIDRDTATLSGGETFLASLALALGLADVVTAESAGTPMEALFVDEGFGTLDEETLDEVMNVLDDLRAGGRIVGIVSHVSELRQRIPAQVHVRKGRAGSHVEVTAG